MNQPLNTSGFMVLLNGRILIYEEQLSDEFVSSYEQDFNVTQVSNTITIQGLGLADEYGVSCDNVSVYEITSDSHRIWTNSC
jgi:hypothetical protein